MLAVALAASLLGPGPRTAAAAVGDDSQCPSKGASAKSLELAAELMDNRYTFKPHRTVRLPAVLRWSENPLGDTNWQFQFHSLRWAESLHAAWRHTGDRDYLNRYYILLREWTLNNPRTNPPSRFSWDEHSTAWRAIVLACAYERLGGRAWLLDAINLHASVLKDRKNYAVLGNHALNQDLGLLALGCVRNNREWMNYAAWRIKLLAEKSIDPEGVNNEQAVTYQHYNYSRYGVAEARMTACGFRPPALLMERRAKMPTFLAHATLPDGTYEMIGDTERGRAHFIPGTEAHFAATRGRSGPKPAETSKLYASAGYAFVRSGWGETRPYTDETYVSMRFGPGRRYHGHRDQSAITLYAYGARLLYDAGKFGYGSGPFRWYFVHGHAHNILAPDGRGYNERRPIELTGSRQNARLDYFAVRQRSWTNTDQRRRVLYSRTGDYLVVQDVARSEWDTTWRQLWHLPYDGDGPLVHGASVRTRRDRGNVELIWADGGPDLQIVRGRRSPMQGWLSFKWGRAARAPVVEAVKEGKRVRYLTFIVPSEHRRSFRVVSARTTDRTVHATVEIDGRRENIIINGDTASVAPAR